MAARPSNQPPPQLHDVTDAGRFYQLPRPLDGDQPALMPIYTPVREVYI